MTNICAPTFVFLAGSGMAFSIARKHSGGIPDKQIDADLIMRGLFILALDPLWMSLGFGGRTVFQVLYAIGGGICCMALLRRLGVGMLLTIGLALLIGSEALAGLAVWLGDGQRPGPIGAMLASGGRLGFYLFCIRWAAGIPCLKECIRKVFCALFKSMQGFKLLLRWRWLYE